MIERRIRSIPPRTTLDALREQEGRRGRIGRGSLRQDNGGFNVEDHVFRKPAQERPSKTLVYPEIEKITWEVETIGDIFESQIVPKTKDVNPFFREEIYYPPLLTLYDPTSMMLSYNKGLVIVSYKACG